DMLVLYTDGVIEARSPSRAFYPLAERVASFPATNPDTLLHHIHRDLLAHAGGHLADDAALLVIARCDSHSL
ncbi:SpoIIE family protein phosphatase, partial [Streptomyces sp. NPDC057543]|uniref:SpoIIE family protein phosphatase n=1 Tax=Streptomyces sp. NPDC057543 TaxID=3346163 RepID=UPI0036AB6D6F